MGVILFLLIDGIIMGFISRYLAQSKGYEGGFAWGFWLGLIGVLVVGFRPNQVQEQIVCPSRYGSDEYRMTSLNEHFDYAPRKPKAKGWVCVCGSRNPSSIDCCMSCHKTREEATEEKVSCAHCGASNKKSNILCFACGQPVDGSVRAIEEVYEEVQLKAEVERKDYVDILEKIAKLHEQGILTDTEFEQKKSDILSKI